MIFLSLGTNLGDRLANLSKARSLLTAKVQIDKASPIYETPPWGFTDQPAFLNQVLQVETDLQPLELLAFLKQIETSMGRQPTRRYGPRLIDLDILFYHDQVLELPQLVIPHPHLHERAFVLVPLADLAPEFKHPVNGKTVKEMLEEVDSEGIRLFSI